jgi:uncharacterized protein (TIGR02271 family)
LADNKSSVHVEPRESGWAVVREGSERATSLHQTQAEAAKEGRNIARQEETEFFLHAQDGRVREHRSYGEGAHSAEEASGRSAGPLDAVAETVGEVTTGVSAAVGALGDGTTREAGESPAREVERSGPATQAARGGETPSEESGDTKEERDLAGDQYDDRSLEERYSGYEIYDEDGERIGKLDDLFVDETDNTEYVGVRTGLSDTGSLLIPADVVTVDDRLRRMVVSRSKSVVEAGPTYGAYEEVTPAFDERVRSHYGLASGQGAADKGDYGTYYHRDEERAESGRTSSGAVGPAVGSARTGKVREGDREGSLEFDRDQDDKDEFRVRRVEEEIKVGTREREAGAVRVRKRVITDHERIVVPKKRVEVTVEHVPVEGQAISAEEGSAEADIGEDEIVVPVVEEEVVVEKRPVVKEEIHIRKEVVEDSEVVEEDVRREEVEVDDEITQRDL